MIKQHLALVALIATSGGSLFPSLAQAEERRASRACESYDAKCSSSATPSAGSPSQPTSAARSDAMKKRQFFEMMRKNEGAILRDDKALISSAPQPAKKQL